MPKGKRWLLSPIEWLFLAFVLGCIWWMRERDRRVRDTINAKALPDSVLVHRICVDHEPEPGMSELAVSMFCSDSAVRRMGHLSR